jgi:hypothetical protein
VVNLPLLAVVVVLIVAVFMGVPPVVAFLFMPCAASTYMPDATWRTQGEYVQREGIAHP